MCEASARVTGMPTQTQPLCYITRGYYDTAPGASVSEFYSSFNTLPFHTHSRTSQAHHTYTYGNVWAETLNYLEGVCNES